MVRFLKYILSKIFKKSNHNVTVTITKFAIKKTVYIKKRRLYFFASQAGVESKQTMENMGG